MANELPKPSLRPPDLPKPNIQPPTPPVPDFAPPPEPPAAAPDPGVKVNVRVAEKPNVEIEETDVEELAGINPRVVAAVIDFLVMAGIWLVLDIFLPGSLAWLAGAAYFLCRDALPFLGGQSVGKKAMKIRAVTRDGSEPLTGNWAASIVRNVTLLILPFGIVELVMVLQREDSQDHGRRFGDDWAKTKVIVVKPPREEAEEPAVTDEPPEES